MSKLEQMKDLRDELDVIREEFEEDYARLEADIKRQEEGSCDGDCENCESNHEYEKLVDCNIKDELGILIEEDDGEIYITLQDLDNGDIITITEEQLHAIVKLFNCACE